MQYYHEKEFNIGGVVDRSDIKITNFTLFRQIPTFSPIF
jgi:hypothetical protein